MGQTDGGRVWVSGGGDRGVQWSRHMLLGHVQLSVIHVLDFFLSYLDAAFLISLDTTIAADY